MAPPNTGAKWSRCWCAERLRQSWSNRKGMVMARLKLRINGDDTEVEARETALLRRNPRTTLEEIKVGLDGNLCRCTGYTGIFEAIQACAARARSRRRAVQRSEFKAQCPEKP